MINYQSLIRVLHADEGSVSKDRILLEKIRKAKYFIFDEAHYFMADCEFNESIRACTDALINLRVEMHHTVWLFMTATPDYLGLWLIYFMHKVQEKLKYVNENWGFHAYTGLPEALYHIDSSVMSELCANARSGSWHIPTYAALKNMLSNRVDPDIFKRVEGPIDRMENICLSKYLPSKGDGVKFTFFSNQYQIYKSDIQAHLDAFSCYNISADYSYINPVYYNNRDDIIEAISYAPAEERWLIFTASEKEGVEIKDRLDEKKIDTVFITASNKRNRKGPIAHAHKIICERSKFDAHVLIATKVIDNGVNLSDESIKHIVIDSTNNTTFLQMLGRRRVNTAEKERINLYLRDISQGALMSRLKRETLDKYLFCHQFPAAKQMHLSGISNPDYKKWFIYTCFDANTIIKQKYRQNLWFDPSQRVTVSSQTIEDKANLLSTYDLVPLLQLKVNWDTYCILQEVEAACQERNAVLLDQFAEPLKELQASVGRFITGEVKQVKVFWDEWGKADEELIEKQHLWLKIQLSWINANTEANAPSKSDRWYTEVLNIREEKQKVLEDFLYQRNGVLRPEEKKQLQELYLQFVRSIRPKYDAPSGYGLDAINRGLEKCEIPYRISKVKKNCWGKYGIYWEIIPINL